MIKGVIFDMDGVLIDSEKLYNRFWREASKEFGFDMTREIALGIRSLPAEFAIPKLERIFGKGYPYYEIKKRRIELMNKFVDENGIEAKAGVNELLDYMKANGIKAAVATASDMDRTYKYLNMINIYHKFDEFVCGPDVKRGKPQPDIYLAAAKKLELMPEECIAVEDSPNGALAGIAAGCMTIVVPDLDEPENDLKDKLFSVVQSLDKIIDFLNL